MDDWERKQAANKRDERANALDWLRAERALLAAAQGMARDWGCPADCPGAERRGSFCKCDVLRSQERLKASKTRDMADRGVG